MSTVIDTILQQVNRELAGLPGVVGVVLGGSRARGTHRPMSDVDIGIYYEEALGFDARDVNRVAAKVDDQHRDNLITPLGGWGPWVNGGGWLVIQGVHVDFILRDVNRVAQVIDDCLAGAVSPHYQAGHPHAYINAMYMGEVAVCRILADPDGRIAALKAKTTPYPNALKEALIGYFLFEASFSLRFAEKYVDQDDLSYVAGHCFRAVSSMNQVLFAINEEYCLNEKRAVAMVEQFAVKPDHYKQRIDEVFSLLSTDWERAQAGVNVLKELVAETERLAGR